MFAELKSLVAASPIAMMVAAEGDQLRVTIMQKKGRRGAPVNLSILGTAEELDRDLPGSIATAAGDLARPAPIAEQVKTQIAVAKSSAASRQPSARKTKSAKPKPAPKPKKAAAPKPARKIALPGARRTKKKPEPRATSHEPRTPSSDGVKHHASKPGKEQCIADYKAMRAKHGDKLNRELFIEKSATGRRFERLWGMSWRKFVDEAEGATPSAASHQPPAKKAKPAKLPGEWPFPDKDRNSASPRAGQASSSSRGGPAREAGADPAAEIPPGLRPGAPAQVAAEERAENTADSDQQVERADTSKPHPPRVIKERDGKLIAGGFTAHVKPGEELTLAGRKWIVVEANERQIIAGPRAEGAS